jgi:16S rRNA (cytosine1402-N4)-methyltransferase
MPSSNEGHRSVLLQEVIELLNIQADDIVVDATLGGAGHALAFAKLLSAGGVLIGVDADEDAILRARERLANAAPTVLLINDNFRNLERELERLDVQQVSKALFDLGWSSYQLQAGRGFSFLADEPLSMAYGKAQSLSAATIVNEWGEESLADIIYGWGEERYSRRIAKAIAEAREKKAIATSRELGEIVAHAVPAAYRRGKLHPATKTFQALRIATNDELGALREGLQAAWKKLKPGGRIAVISFHSIEDRIVKEMFVQWEREGEGQRLTKKPITASEEELAENPRARSAKLRGIEKY